MEELDKTSLESTISNSQKPLTSIIPEGQFNFVPVEEMFENPMTAIGDVIATDPGIISNIDTYKTDIDKYGIGAMASLGSPIPSFATDNYNPVAQQNPTKNTFSQVEEILDADYSEGAATDIIAPKYSSMKASQFARYYEHPDFAKLGFSPYSNTEEYYNANSTIYDDMARMRGQFWSLAGSGFSSVYRSVGDLFDGDDYLYAPDLSTAQEFENAMAIGNSSRDGAGAWTNNFLLNSAYTVGILGSIAVEELALAGASAAVSSTGVGIPAGVGGFITGSAAILARGYNAITNSIDATRAYKASRDVFTTLKQTDAAKDFWTAANTGKKVLGHMFAPNTMYALKNLKTTKNATQNAVNMAKMSSTFGGFYRDLRAVNLALAESKLEGGMVYNQIISQGIRIAENKSGKGVTPEEMQTIVNRANQGAFYTTMANAPIIYASNWFVFGNALGGFNRSLGRVFNDSFSRGIRRVVKTKATRTSTGGLAENVFEDVGKGIAGTIKAVKAGGAKGIVGRGAAASVRYFAANIAEGIQEVSQEAVSAATIGYFTEVLKDPLAGGVELQNTMIQSGIGKQLSGEGFSVFMSGFLMGGVIQGPQKLFFQGVPSIYKYGLNEAGINYGSKSQNEAWADYKTQRDEFIKKTVTAHNQAWNTHIKTPEGMFDSNKLNFLIQKQVAGAMKASTYDSDQFGFIDQQDFGKFQQMYHVFSNNTSGIFRSQLTDMLKLTDEELAQAYPADKKDIKSGKLRKRISNMVTELDKMENQYQDSKDKYPNPFDRNIYKEGTREYVDESHKELAYEHARYLYMFTRDGFDKALARSKSINSRLESEPLFEKMAASDITVLLSMDSIDREINMLTTEVELTKVDGVTLDKSVKESNKSKTKKIEKLNAIKAILIDPKNATTSEGGRKGAFDRRKIEKVRSAFKDYVRYMASSTDSFVNNDNIDAALKDIIDYIALEERAKIYDKAIEYLDNPKRLSEIAERQYAVSKEYYKNIKGNFEEALTKYVDIVEANQLMNEISGDPINAFVDPLETEMFLQTNDSSVLKTFYDDNGSINRFNEDGINLIVNKSKYDLIQAKIKNYVGIKTKSDETVPVEKTEEQIIDQINEENFSETEAILKDAGIEIILPETNNTPLLNSLLNKQYSLYSALTATAKEDVLTFDEWRDSQQGINIKTSFNAIKKIWAAGVAKVDQSTGEIIYSNVISDVDILSEKGFLDWSKTRDAIEDPNISKILDLSGLNYNDIFEVAAPVVEQGDVVNKNTQGETTKKIYYVGNLANIVEITTLDNQTGEPINFYKLVDKNGNDLSKQMRALTTSEFGSYTSAADAKADLKLVEASAPSTGKFSFDGVDGLSQGTIIYDKLKSKKYIVLSTPNQIKGGRLKIVEASKNNKDRQESDIIKLEVGEFAESYTLQEISFKKLDKSYNRIQISELISFYPHVGVGGRAAAVARLQLILSILTPAELAQLELVIVQEENSGSSKGLYQIKGRDGTVYGEQNPYITELVSKYNIGIKIPEANVELNIRINTALEKARLPKTDGINNVFGYLPNARFKINVNGKDIVLPNITSEEATNTIFNSAELKGLNKEERLSYIQNIFALNELIVSQLDNKVASKQPMPKTLSEISKDLTFITPGAITAYPRGKGNQKGRAFSELLFNDSDGNGGIVIYDLKFDHESQSRTIQTVTNLEGVIQEDILRDDVQEGLEGQQLFNKMLEGSDRYYAIVLMPNGTYVPVNLKATIYTAEQRNQLYLNIIKQSQLTQEKNIDGDGKVKDARYNYEFNSNLTGELFISTIPGYLISLEITSQGIPALQLFKINGEKIDKVGEPITIDLDLVNDTKLTSNEKIETLFKKFNAEFSDSTAVAITPNRLRESFADGTDVNTILEKTTTAVLPNVIENQQVRITGSSSAIQAVINVSAIPAAEVITEETSEFDINMLEYAESQEEVDSLIARGYTYAGKNDDGLPAYSKVYLVKDQQSTQTSEVERSESILDSQDVLKEYTNKEISAILRSNIPSVIEDSLGNKISESIVKYEKGEAIRTNYQYGIIDKVSASDGSVVSRLLDLGNNQVGTSNMEINMGAMERFNKAEFGKDGVYLGNTDIVVLLKDSLGGVIKAPVAQQTSEVVAPIENSIDKINTEIALLELELLEDVELALHAKTLRDSEKFQDLIKKRKIEENKANKIVPVGELSTDNIIDIEEFSDFVSESLPEFITVEDINTLTDNMKAGGVRVGMFSMGLKNIAGNMSVDGTIYVGAKSPFKYHEAFHSVYRLLLTDEEIVRYRNIARKEVRAKLRGEGKSFKTELERFRNSADTYLNMSQTELENRYYEEYLADEFDKFKLNPKNTKVDAEVKSLFVRIMEWIKAIFSTNTKNELEALFENIDLGKYKDATLVSNEFTNSLAPGITLEANALVPYNSDTVVTEVGGVKQTRVGYLYLDSEVADLLVAGISATYADRVRNVEGEYSPAELLQSVMDDYNLLYNPLNSINQNQTPAKVEKLNQIQTAFKIYPEVIKKNVVDQLNLIGSQIQDEEFTEEEFEDSLGLRTSSQFDKDASLIGGLSSLSFKLRLYIASTTTSATDYFGNTLLKENEKIIVGVNFREAYNGLLKAVKNIQDPLLMLRSMYFFGQDNAQAGAVVSRILKDVGITEIELLEGASFPVQLNNPELLQSLLAGFQNFRVDYIFNETDSKGKIRIYSAAQRDDANSQLQKWNQAYIGKRKQFDDPKVKKQIARLLNSLNSSLKDTNNIDDVTLQNQARDYSERLFNLTGIKLSPLYLQFSMIQNIIDNTSVKQNALLSINTEESALSIADVEQMRLALQRNSNLFTNDKGGILSRLNDLAANSAPFDETIGATVFKNSNGDLVYAHQLPTYHLKTIQSLNSISELNRLMDLNPYMRDNFLLNSEAFKALSNQNKIRVVRIAGSKTVDEILTEEDINDNISKNVSSQTYNEFTTKDFALALINNYTAYLNTKSDKVDVITELGSTKPLAALAPVLIRVIESSGTADMVALPVIKAVESVKGKVVLTEKAVDEFYNKINTEFTRINLEAFKLEDGSMPNEMLMGYNDSVDGRAFKFSNTNMMFSDAFQSNLANIAIEEGKKLSIISLEDAIKTAGSTVNEFKNNIVEKVEIQYTKFNETLVSINASESLSNNITQGPMIAKGVSSVQLDDSANLLNLTNNKSYNLKQIFFNNWINTSSINEVLLGDEAVTLKNAIDQVKRAKAQNAAYISAYSAITAPKLGIMHPNEDVSLITIDEIIGKSSITEESIDRADAQMWMTTKAFRYTQFAFGNLDASMAGLINDIEAGIEITDDAIFGTDSEKVGYIDQQAMLNSKKLVYADGKTYLKISAFVLTKEYTSKYNDNTEVWEAKPNRIPLHNLRVAMEAIEASKNTISIAVPLSGSKMLKRRVVQADSINPNNTTLTSHSTLDARYFGLQVVNPSNKLEGLDPTQIKEIATSEQIDSVEIPGLGFNEKGKVMKVGDVRRLYNFTVSQRLELSFKNKRNLIYTFDSSMDELKVSKEKGAVTPNLVAFLNYATKSLKASQSSSSLIEFFSTTDGVQNYNLNNPLTIRKFEQLFFSYFSRGVFSERVPSLGLTLVSDYGNSVYRKVYEIKNGIPIRSEVIREKIAEKMNLDLTLSINELTPNTPGLSSGIIVLDRLRTNLMGYTDVTNPDTATGERYTEGMMPAHFKSVRKLIENGNSTMPDVISKMFSVRIPTQDNHSAMGVKLVDFMPVFYGSSAMFAQELVEISGADFDNDKAYTLIKEFYVANNEFIEYGKGSDLYFEYITYINEKVNKAGTIYSEALGLYNNRQLQARIENSATENDLSIASDAGLSEKAIRSLQILGLPITNVQFNKYKSKYGEPYAAPLNNKILDYKYALITNRGVTEKIKGMQVPISYQPANTLILTNTLETLAAKSDYFKNKLNEEVVDVNNLDGMIKSFEANNGTSIGAVVKPNLYLSLLTEYRIKLKPASIINVNGKSYGNYGVTVVNGQRKQDTISALVTMETDNSKDRLVSKLGLNKHAVALVTNLTALGVPLETSILLVNNPLIKQHYTTALNKEFKFDIGISGLVKQSLREYKEAGAKLIQVTDAILLESINSDGRLSSNNKMYSILNLFKKANRIKEYTSGMGAITSLSKGLGKNMVELNDKAKAIAELFAYDAPMNLSPVYKGKTFQNTYLRLFYQVKNTLMPATFLTASSEFTDILKPTLSNLNTSSREFTEEIMQDVRVDLLSYLTIKAFDQYGLNNAPGKVATLNNSIVYPNDGPSIIDIVDRLQKYVDSTGDTNVFLNDFIARDNAIDPDNSTGMNLINANSFRNITAGQKIDLQNDYAKLYGNLTTKDDAISILNYIMVKDGLQLKYNSLLEAISPFVMSDYLGQINSVERVLRGQSTYESVFNMSKEELMRDFQLGYLSSNINNSKIQSITPKFGAQKKSTITWKRKDGVLTFTGGVPLTKEEIKLGEYQQGNFLRVSFETGMEGMLKTETYYTPGRGVGVETEGTYNRIDTMGSNQQTGIGFMFGERPSYEQVRAYVKNKNGEETTVDQSTTSISVTRDAIDKQVKEDILKSDTTTIVATNDSVDVKVTEDSKAVNISNSASLLTSLLSRQNAIEEEMDRSMLVSETDAALPVLDPKQQIQYDLFESDITDESAKYPYLAEQYDEMLKVDANKETMMDNNLFPFSSMVEEYQNSSKYESKGEEINQQEFIDNIKKCILK